MVDYPFEPSKRHGRNYKIIRRNARGPYVGTFLRARPDSHESVLAAPKGADTPAPEGADTPAPEGEHTPASEEVVPSASKEANNSRSAYEPSQSQQDNDDRKCVKFIWGQ